MLINTGTIRSFVDRNLDFELARSCLLSWRRYILRRIKASKNRTGILVIVRAAVVQHLACRHAHLLVEHQRLIAGDWEQQQGTYFSRHGHEW